ncbi:MAG: hypothetical protein ACI8XM_000880 [Haloarculaceae archaeon]|jgi:hypothetical protein
MITNVCPQSRQASIADPYWLLFLMSILDMVGDCHNK